MLEKSFSPEQCKKMCDISDDCVAYSYSKCTEKCGGSTNPYYCHLFSFNKKSTDENNFMSKENYSKPGNGFNNVLYNGSDKAKIEIDGTKYGFGVGTSDYIKKIGKKCAIKSKYLI